MILNLGCGTRASAHRSVINVDRSIALRIRNNAVLRSVAPLFLNGDRLARIRALPSNILLHDLRSDLPFESGSVDAVYHSHLLEHLDRDDARRLLREAKRVLRPGGVQRIVVPDLEKLCRNYLDHLSACESDPRNAARHDRYVSDLIEQSVRKEAAGTSRQRPLRRYLENALLGDARRRGETHQWMYDRISLAALLKELGYREVSTRTHRSSAIPGWDEIGLDADALGNEYKPDSLYVEAVK